MRLHVNTWKDKDGSEQGAIKVRKLSATGKGLAIGDELDLELTYDPQFKECVAKTDGSTWTAINILAKWEAAPQSFHKYRHPEYESYRFDLPSGKEVLEKLKGLSGGDKIKIYLEAYVSPQGKEGVAWKVDVTKNEAKSAAVAAPTAPVAAAPAADQDELPF